MKSVLTIVVLLNFFTMILMQNMPRIQRGYYNTETKAIEIDIQYSGGCAKHEFRLQIEACRESYPVQCDANLIDLTTNDFCEAFLHQKVSIGMHEAGLDDEYYRGASIAIHGSGNSKAYITLPW